MRAQRLSVLAVGALAVLGAAPYTAMSAQAATAAPKGTAAAAAAPATELVVEGQAGDMVTGGFTGVEQGSGYAMMANADLNGGGIPPSSDISFQSIHNGETSDPTSFGFSFHMPSGQQWAVGQTYTNTEGIVYGGGTQPWFYFSQFNTGPCGRPSDEIGAEDDKGTVKIDDLTWTNGPNSQVASMELEFSQSCHGGPATRGLFRFNETGPVPPGAPTGQPLPAGQGTVAPLTFRRGTSILAAPAGAVDGPRLATVSSESEGRTAWNPLGTRLLYSSDPGLSTVHPDGSGAAPLTEVPGVRTKDSEPAVSWDGSVVVFVQGDGGAVANLVSENTDGTTAGDAYRLPTGPACQQEHSPSFETDGSLIYECVTGDAHSTYRLTGSGASQLIPNSSQPAFSPDVSKIAFVRPDGSGIAQIFTANADGSGVTQVSHDPNGASKPAWSPDGKYLAYANETFHEILEIPAAGGSPVGSIPDADDPDFTPPVLDSHVLREWGADRVGTAIATSQLNFANHGAADGRIPAGAVVLARSDTFADALGGSALAVRTDAPLLITGSAGLDPAVKAEISRVLAPGGKVYLLGGTQALSPAVASALSHYTVVRLAGQTRYGTAVAIAKQINPRPGMVMIATGAQFPDALAAGATGQPVLLTDGGAMPKETLDYLKTLNPNPETAGGTQLVTIGGPGDAALISAYQGDKMPAWPTTISRLKLAGADRYATSLMVAQDFFAANSNLALATGATWPDALSGGAMIGLRGGPLLLTAPTGISPAMLSYLRSQSASLYDAFLMGGTVALPNTIAQQVAAVIGLPGHVRVGGAYAAGVETTAGAGTKADTSGAAGSAPAGAPAGSAGRTAHGGEVATVSREG
ncbi:hypothetical protein ABIA35_000219 [Catenulispora sp. MAP12-49]|uniref:cell wall-binding repeat-containing protein n=1 Tax=Catenulispora sp. MAP12-49 TaxID=3156302 RepID=UPI003515A859